MNQNTYQTTIRVRLDVGDFTINVDRPASTTLIREVMDIADKFTQTADSGYSYPFHTNINYIYIHTETIEPVEQPSVEMPIVEYATGIPGSSDVMVTDMHTLVPSDIVDPPFSRVERGFENRIHNFDDGEN